MRTADFSSAPALAQAKVEFVGAISFTGPGAILRLAPNWIRMMRRLRRSPGYCGMRLTYGFPFTMGQMVFFTDRDALLAFARTPEHARLMAWTAQPRNARNGFIRIYDAEPGGYSNGGWRAEGPHEVGVIKRFRPIGGEQRGPLVSEMATDDGRPQRRCPVDLGR